LAIVRADPCVGVAGLRRAGRWSGSRRVAEVADRREYRSRTSATGSGKTPSLKPGSRRPSFGSSATTLSRLSGRFLRHPGPADGRWDYPRTPWQGRPVWTPVPSPSGREANSGHSAPPRKGSFGSSRGSVAHSRISGRTRCAAQPDGPTPSGTGIPGEDEDWFAPGSDTKGGHGPEGAPWVHG
jgi:hypothetical protein